MARQKSKSAARKREGDVLKTSLNGCTFTVTQRNKWKPLKGELCFYQRTEQRNQQFCDSSFEGFLLFGVECWGVCGALAAEAIWVSSTSKVGQLVPVPLLMCWRGALCGGLRARLKGLRSLLGGGGWIWPTKVGVRTSGPCESCTLSTDLWGSSYRPGRHTASQQMERGAVTVPTVHSTAASLMSENQRVSKTKFVDHLWLNSYQQPYSGL